MKKITIKKTLSLPLLAVIMLLITGFKVQAQTDFTVKFNKALIKGTSTLHDWESKITEPVGKGSYQLKGNTIIAIKNLELKIPVKSIKSKEGKIMDDKTYDAFHSDEHPLITFSFTDTPVKMDASQQVSITAKGFLTMAGTVRPVTLTAKGAALINGDLELFISEKIKMTDYNMVPPKAVLGTIHVGDEITVSFDIILERTKTQIQSKN